MADDLNLGGITFDGFSTPAAMGAGGKQAMVIHKLPGGNRVIDTLGPDEDNITWSGEFFGNNTDRDIAELDGMRIAGQVVSLTFAGQFRSVVVESFNYHWRRFPVWADYHISCVVYQNPSGGSPGRLGNIGGVGTSINSIDALAAADLAIAIGLAQ